VCYVSMLVKIDHLFPAGAHLSFQLVTEDTPLPPPAEIFPIDVLILFAFHYLFPSFAGMATPRQSFLKQMRKNESNGH